VCSSPKLIAAYHVLLRLIDPRHPPYALICFKKVYSVLDPRTISKVQRRRPLAIYIAIDSLLIYYYYYNLFSQYVKELIQQARCNWHTCNMNKKMFRLRTSSDLSSHLIFFKRTLFAPGFAYCLRAYCLLVEDIGVEPMTLCVQGRCSSQLS
jgi:hypothetical protein